MLSAAILLAIAIIKVSLPVYRPFSGRCKSMKPLRDQKQGLQGDVPNEELVSDF